MIKLFRLPFKLISCLHRKIDPIGHARSMGVNIGSNCRLINVDFGSEPYLVTIGNHFSGTNANFITHDGGVWLFRAEFPELDVVAPIRIGNNVFLGSGVTILPGVTIGDNVVVGAGAIVTRSIPSNCVAAGVPAKPLRDIDTYKAKCVAQGRPTKSLSPKAKRKYYEEFYQKRNQ
jgi:acetyltransferase-like isoleucine patch superfamily enzyme